MIWCSGAWPVSRDAAEHPGGRVRWHPAVPPGQLQAGWLGHRGPDPAWGAACTTAPTLLLALDSDIYAEIPDESSRPRSGGGCHPLVPSHPSAPSPTPSPPPQNHEGSEVLPSLPTLLPGGGLRCGAGPLALSVGPCPGRWHPPVRPRPFSAALRDLPRGRHAGQDPGGRLLRRGVRGHLHQPGGCAVLPPLPRPCPLPLHPRGERGRAAPASPCRRGSGSTWP